jgi:beta-phosphoglucomutase-like phosphatase (HAD superfamily)
MDTDWSYDDYAVRDATGDDYGPTTGSGISSELEGLVLDVCGVLYDNSPWRRWLLQLLNRVGLHAHYDLFYRVWDRDYQDDVITGGRCYWDAMRSYLRSAGISAAQVTEIEAAGRAKREELEEDVRLFPGVRRTIQQLGAQGVRLTVACSSPWPVEFIEDKLTQMSIRSFFSQVVTTKTDDGIGSFDHCIQAAAEGLDVNAKHVGFVGSDPQGLQFARRAHTNTIAVNSPLDAVADVHIRRFEDLFDVVSFRQVQRLAS